MTTPLLSVSGLDVEYPSRGLGRPPFRALNGVSLSIGAGETVGLVGESGSGKTTLGRAILGLAPVSAGTILFDGADISHLRRRSRRKLSDRLQVVFQDPYSSLNPSLTISQILTEPLRVAGFTQKAAASRVGELLDEVQMPRGSGDRLPREFSGGQRQRIAIARALALSPSLIVCDESVSALDLSTQARVLELFKSIQQDTGVAYLFISHDLAVVRFLSDRVAVMYRGEIVEVGDAAQVTSNPGHAYTRKLLLAAPIADPTKQAARRAAREKLLRT